MLTLEKIVADKWVKCNCCGEQIRNSETYFQVQKDGKNVRGERYCKGCEEIAYENNDFDSPHENDEEYHLRQMETFGAYRAAGCASQYFDDMH